MQRFQVIEAVRMAAAEASGRSFDDIAIRTTMDELALDSLGIIELTVGVEEACDVEIGCGQRIEMETVGCFVDVACEQIERLHQMRIAA
jgi:acyl carrier protein